MKGVLCYTVDIRHSVVKQRHYSKIYFDESAVKPPHYPRFTIRVIVVQSQFLLANVDAIVEKKRQF